MTDPERVEALAEALHGLACTRHATVDACDYEADYRADAEALAPLLAEWRAADRAEALREVEALDFRGHRLRTVTEDPWVKGWNRALETCRDDLSAALAAEPDAGGDRG